MKIQLKKIIVALLAILTCPYMYSQSYCDSNPVDIHGDLSVSGNKIVDQNNVAVSFAGNSLFWSNTGWGGEDYYTADVVSSLKNDWGTTIVRAAMGVEDSGGYLSDSSNKDRVKTVVDAAIAEGLYVIIDWHSHGAENYESQAVAFFEEMASLYGNYSNIIYEIYNEPIYSSWSGAIKPYAETVISAIRAIDPDNLIIVGTPTWSQDVDVASNDPITTSTNIAYTLHFYAGTHGASYRAKAQTALDNGIALMVTEWGTVDASGDGSVNYSSTEEWMDFLQENDISHLNWSVNDKSEGASVLNPGASSSGNWSDADLTESGTYLKTIIQGWSQYCNGEPIDPIVVEPKEYTLIPARIEAEDYDTQSGTQSESTDDVDGDFNIGYIDINDFLTYNINVENAGTYNIYFRVASAANDISFDIYSNTNNIGSISSDATGDWQTWKTVSTSVTLSSGEQTIKLVATDSEWNINWLEFSEEEIIDDVVEETTDYISIPSRIEAENYNAQSGTQSQSTGDVDGDLNIGWIDSGDYLSYPINVTNSGDYTIDFRIASESAGINFDIYADNNIIGSLSSSATGNWQTWKTVSTTVSLNVGDQIIKLVATDGGWNINWLSFSEGEEQVQEEDNTSSTNCSNIATWSANTVYSEAGTQVVYENNIYENKWYTLNQNPVSFSVNSWDLWTLIGPCDSAKSLSKSIIEDENIIKIFQNSLTNSLNIYVDNTNHYSNATVFDIQGRVIINQKLNQNSSQISLKSFNKGVYFVKLSGQKSFTKAFLKK